MNKHRFEWLLAMGVLGIGMLITGSTFWGSFLSYTPVPWGDLWGFPTLAFETKSGFSNLAALLNHQHNEHRLGLFIAFLMLDYRLFGSQQVMLFVAVLALYSCFAVLWIKAILGVRQEHSQSGRVLWVGLGMSVVFSAIQAENLFAPTGIAFIGLFLFASIAFVSVSRCAVSQSNGNRGVGWLCLSLASAFLATWSLGSGWFAFMVLVFLHFTLRLKWWTYLPLFIVWGLVTWLYFDGYRFAVRPPINFGHIPHYFAYVAQFLGSVFYYPNLPLSMIMGSVGLVLGTWVIGDFMFREGELRRSWAPLIAMMLFCAGCGLVASLGRQHLGLGQALSSRYTTFSLVFMISLLGSGFWLSPAKSNWLRRILKTVQGTMLIAFIFVIVSKQAGNIGWRSDEATERNIVGLALASDILDEHHFKYLFPYPQRYIKGLSAEIELLKARRMSVFGSRWYDETGRDLASIYSFSSDQQAREIEGVDYVLEPVRALIGEHMGWKLEGWIPKDLQFEYLVVADASSVILGHALLGVEKRGPISVMLPQKRSGRQAFMGFFRGAGPHRFPLQVFGVKGPGLTRLFEIEHVWKPGFLSKQGADLLMKEGMVSASEFSCTPGSGWTENGYYPFEGFKSLESGRVFGSWSGSDANTGTLELVLRKNPDVESGKVLIIPIMRGPGSPEGEIIVQQGETEHRVPLPESHHQWFFYQLSLDSAKLGVEDSIHIFVTDSGSGWGEWLAVGAPMTRNQ